MRRRPKGPSEAEKTALAAGIPPEFVAGPVIDDWCEPTILNKFLDGEEMGPDENILSSTWRRYRDAVHEWADTQPDPAAAFHSVPHGRPRWADGHHW